METSGIFDSIVGGVRLVVEPIPSTLAASVGIYVRAGAMHETAGTGGVYHWTEHMVFKGTERFPVARDLVLRVEGKGGMLNANTSSHRTLYLANVLGRHMPAAYETLADMVLRPLIRDEDFETERGVILEEILRSKDDPDSLVWDFFDASRYPDHPFGRPTLGTEESVGSLAPDGMRDAIDARYRAPHMVVSMAGAVSVADAVELTKRLFDGVRRGSREGEARVSPPSRAEGTLRHGDFKMEDDVQQTHFVIGTGGPSYQDRSRFAGQLVHAIFGGEMYSRLFQEVRERRGLVYGIGSYQRSYPEMGLNMVYGGTSHANWPEVREVVAAEAARLRRDGLTAAELELARDTLLGQLALSTESAASRMMRNGEGVLNQGRPVPLAENVQRYEAVTLDEVNAHCERFMPDDEATVAVIAR